MVLRPNRVEVSERAAQRWLLFHNVSVKALLPDIVDAKRDVMKPGTTLFDVACDHRVSARGLEELEGRLARGDEVRPHALAGDFLGDLDVKPERIPIERQRLVEILHGDADVVEDGFHDGFAGSAAASGAVRRGTPPTLAISSPTAE